MPTFQDLDSIKHFVFGGFITLFVFLGALSWRMSKLQNRIAALEAQSLAKSERHERRP